MKALVYKCRGYTRAHTAQSIVLIGRIKPKRVPMLCRGVSYPVGTKFFYLGGTNTSAGFEWMDFKKNPVVYRGMFQGHDRCDKSLACFTQGNAPQGGFFAWAPTEFGLIWGTHARAGRVIEMTKVRFQLPTKVCKREKTTGLKNKSPRRTNKEKPKEKT